MSGAFVKRFPQEDDKREAENLPRENQDFGVEQGLLGEVVEGI